MLDYSVNELNQHIVSLHELACTELCRTHENHGLPGDRLVLACRTCGMRFPELKVSIAPVPATVAHHDNCEWLRQWLTFPDELRHDYLVWWRGRRPTAKRLSAPHFVPARLIMGTT